ncbi:hypothetical protein CAAN3_21S00716 [[Candida] anglica]
MKSLTLALLYSTLTLSVHASRGCAPAGVGKGGFNVKIYPYKISDSKTMNDLEYVSYGYFNNKVLSTMNAVKDINFEWSNYPEPDIGYAVENNLYGGPPITITNFTMELTGYYHSVEAGDYTFQLSKIDDSAAVFIGDGIVFDCCKETPTIDPTDYQIFTSKVWNGKTGNTKATVKFAADTYYPMRIVYTNALSSATLQLFVKKPNGDYLQVQSDMFVYDVQRNSCPVPSSSKVTTTSSEWSRSEISSSTSTSSLSESYTIVSISASDTVTIDTTDRSRSDLLSSTLAPSASECNTTVSISAPDTAITLYASETSISTLTPSEGNTTVSKSTPDKVIIATSEWLDSETLPFTPTPLVSGDPSTIEIPTPTRTGTTKWSGFDISTSSSTSSVSDGTPNVDTSTIVKVSNDATVVSCSDGGCTKVPVVEYISSVNGSTSVNKKLYQISSSTIEYSITGTQVSTVEMTVTSCSKGACSRISSTIRELVVTSIPGIGIVSYTTISSLPTLTSSESNTVTGDAWTSANRFVATNTITGNSTLGYSSAAIPPLTTNAENASGKLLSSSFSMLAAFVAICFY